MKNRLYASLVLGLVMFAAILADGGPAQATLGRAADSVVADQKALSATRRAVKRHDNYTIQELNSDSTAVREYVSPSGVVFGIAWNGLVHPDLTQLLGFYAKEYDEARRLAARKPGRRSMQVKTNRVIVEKWGHMRNLQGRAYVPALLPSGVTVDEIR